MSCSPNYRRNRGEAANVAGLSKRPSGPAIVTKERPTNNRRRLFRGETTSRHAPSGGIPAS